MKLFLLTLFCCLIFTAAAHAQENQLGFTVNLSQARSLGYQPNSVAVAAEVIHRLKWPILIGNFSIGRSAKAHLGDGWAISSSNYLRLPVAHDLWVEAGGRLTRQYTSAYRKTALYPAVGAGYNFKNLAVPYVIYNARDLVSENRGHGWSGGSDFYLPISQKWRMRLRVEVTRLSFRQPGRGQLAGTSFDLGLGLSRLTPRSPGRASN